MRPIGRLEESNWPHENRPPILDYGIRKEKTMTKHSTHTGLHHLREALGLCVFALGAVILGSGALF